LLWDIFFFFEKLKLIVVGFFWMLHENMLRKTWFWGVGNLGL